MKKLLILFISFFSLFILGYLGQVEANIYTQENTKIKYCNDGNDCSFEEGVKYAGGITTVFTTGTASAYIQKIVAYLVSFLAIVSVILIIYSGFNLLTSVGDEEKAKKSKTIIIFAILGLFIIFLAKPITTFIINVLNGSPSP